MHDFYKFIPLHLLSLSAGSFTRGQSERAEAACHAGGGVWGEKPVCVQGNGADTKYVFFLIFKMLLKSFWQEIWCVEEHVLSHAGWRTENMAVIRVTSGKTSF